MRSYAPDLDSPRRGAKAAHFRGVMYSLVPGSTKSSQKRFLMTMPLSSQDFLKDLFMLAWKKSRDWGY
jgi:hypothetical protein